MNKIAVIIFSTMAALLTQDATAAGKIHGRSSAAAANTKPWMKCIAVVSSGTSSNPTTAAPTVSPSTSTPAAAQTPTAGGYGISFTLEPNNGNYISADTFSLNGQGQKIKQVGHAEVLSTNSPGNSGSSAVILQNSADSPFQLSVALNAPTASAPVATNVPTTTNAVTSTTTNVPQTVTGTLTSVTLFNGQTISQLPLLCRLSPTVNQQEASAL